MTPQQKTGLHPRNRHQAPYDFDALCLRTPALSPFVFVNEHGTRTLDFADPAAVKALNRALLALHYGIQHWDLPPGYLCPPIPGRVDYLHRVADLLAESAGEVPRGKGVRVLDIGVGANCIYPLLGAREYGWRFVGSDIDPVSVKAAALLAVAAQVFLGARPLQGMLPPLDQVTEFYVSPSHKDMVRFTVEENGLVQALGELRVAWRGPSKRVSAKSARTLAGLAGAIAWRCLEPSKAAACRGWQAAHSLSAM